MELQFKSFKRVLVTGTGGVLGTAIKEKLSKIPGLATCFVTRANCDLTDKVCVEKLFDEFKPDLVLHLAGKVFGVQGNKEFCGEVYYQNIVINTNVIEASRKAGVKKIVAAGTAAIYSDIAPLPMKESDFWLGPPHGSEGPYGHAKRAMLAQLEAYKLQYGLEYSYLILTNLYGPNDRFDEKFGHVVPSLINRFVNATQQKLEEVVCWGDGSPTRDFLYSEDAAMAFLIAAECGDGAMNVATGNSMPIKNLVEAVVSATGYKGNIIWDTTKPMGQLERSYDISKIRSLGFTPEHSLEKGISKSVEWYCANQSDLRA